MVAHLEAHMSFVLAGMLSLILTTSVSAAPPAKGQECAGCHEVDLPRFEKSIHGSLGCRDCHTTIMKLPHADKPRKVDCGSCHSEEATEYAKSVHGSAKKNGMTDAASCTSCHGGPHDILPANDPASKIAKKNMADTCGACHSNPDFLARHNIHFAKPVEAYRLSVHGRAVARGDTNAASCSDCHGSHSILPGEYDKSRTGHKVVAETCGKCHSDVLEVYFQSVHGKAVKAGSTGAPDCTSCHGEHNILAPAEAGSLVNPARVSTVTCGRCHADERLAARYNLAQDKLPSFQDSFHGLAARGGSQTVANCASCHGVHNILASSDPRSSINPKNLNQTCGRCHPGVGQRFVIGPVHVRSATMTEHVSVKWIRLTYLWLIPLTIGFMLLHNGLDYFAKLRSGKHVHGTGEQIPRMNLKFRIAHWMVVVSFISLVITGFALKYPEAAWVKFCFYFSPALRGLIHRVAAVIITVATLYHLVHVAVVKRDRVILPELLPRWQDAKDIFNMFRFNLGLSKTRPTFGMFGYAEKMEYWAFMWGTIVMAVTGLLLWADNWSLSVFPKWVMDAATIAHWYEAILATLSILVWHWYLVLFDPDVYPMDQAWITGKTSADHMRETRPDYYREVMEKLNPEAEGLEEGSVTNEGDPKKGGA